MKMMKNIYYFLFMAFAMLVVSCSDDNFSGGTDDSNSMTVQMTVSAPSYQTTESRAGAADEDGEAIRSLKLLCFDINGNFLGEGNTTFTSSDASTGTISGTVPSSTCRIHFVANANLTSIETGNYIGVSENVMIPTLYSGYGIVNYWGYKRFSSVDEMKNFIKDGNIGLVRNQAKVSVTNSTGISDYNIVGVAVCNVNAFGTVALFDDSKFDSDPYSDGYNKLADNKSTDVVSSVTDDKNIKADNPLDVVTGSEFNFFEGANTQSDPVAVIVKLSNGTYHKILLEDSSYDFMTIHRNHNYTINIKGLVEAGETSFTAALAGAAANNPLISIGDEVASLSYDGVSLEIIGGTTQILGGGNQSISFTYKNTKTNAPSASDLSATWVTAGNTAAETSVSPSISYDGSSNGTISFKLQDAGSTLKSGKLILKVNGTALQRTINIYSISGFTFENMSVSQNIYDDPDYYGGGQQVVLSFDIPENFPKSLLPLKCKIVTNRFDADPNVNNLQIVNESTNTSEFGYRTWNYKYVYTATQTGPQHIYFKTVDKGYLDDASKNKTIWVSAPNFDTKSSDFGFLNSNSYYGAIYISGGSAADASLFENQPPVKGYNLNVGVRVDYNDFKYYYVYTNNFTPSNGSRVYDQDVTSLHPNINCYKVSTSNSVVSLTSNKTNYSESIWFELPYHKSANAVVRTNPSYFANSFSVSTTSPQYGKNKEVTMNINFPVADGNHTYSISTKYLRSNSLSYSGGLYYVTPTSKEGTYTFYTSSLVNTETIIVRAEGGIEVGNATCNLVNAPISGTLTCASFRATPFIYVEDDYGNRVGTITRTKVSETKYSYSLVLRSYYNLTLDSNISLITNDSGNTLKKVRIAIKDLIQSPNQTLQ